MDGSTKERNHWTFSPTQESRCAFEKSEVDGAGEEDGHVLTIWVFRSNMYTCLTKTLKCAVLSRESIAESGGQSIPAH